MKINYFDCPTSFRDCGRHTLCAIAQSMGVVIKREVDHRSIIERLTGMMKPGTLRLLLDRIGFKTLIHSAARLTSDKRIDAIMRIVKNGTPVVLLVGTGPWHLIPHWISVWRYDEMSEKFMVYDPWIGTKTVYIPHGNRLVSGEELVTMWSKPRWLRPWFKELYLVPLPLPGFWIN